MPKSRRKPAARTAGLEELMKLQAGKDIINRYREETKTRFKNEFGAQHNPDSFINDFFEHSIATADAKKALGNAFTAGGVSKFKDDLRKSLDLKFIIYKEILAQNLPDTLQAEVSKFTNGFTLNLQDFKQINENALLSLIESQEKSQSKAYDRDPENVKLPADIKIEGIVKDTVIEEIVNPLLATIQTELEAKLGENNPGATADEVKSFKAAMRDEIRARIEAITNNEDKTLSLTSAANKEIGYIVAHLQQVKYADQRPELEKLQAAQQQSHDAAVARVNANKKPEPTKPAEIPQQKTAAVETKAAKPRTEISSSDLVNLIRKGQVPKLEEKKLMSSDELLASLSSNKKSPKTPPPIIEIEMTEMTPREKKAQQTQSAETAARVEKKRDTWADPVSGATKPASAPPLLSEVNTPTPASRTIVHPEEKKPVVELFTRKPLPKDPEPIPTAPTPTAARVTTPPPIPPKPVYSAPATPTRTQEIKGAGIAPATTPAAESKTQTINVSAAKEVTEPEQAEEKNKVFVRRPQGFETLHRKIPAVPATPAASPAISASAKNVSQPQPPTPAAAAVTRPVTPESKVIPTAPPISRTGSAKPAVAIKKKKRKLKTPYAELKVETTRAPEAPAAIRVEQPGSAPPAATLAEQPSAPVRRVQGLPPLADPATLAGDIPGRRARGLPPLTTPPPLPKGVVSKIDNQNKPDDKLSQSASAASTTPEASPLTATPVTPPVAPAASIPEAPPLDAAANTAPSSGTRQSSTDFAAELKTAGENLRKTETKAESSTASTEPAAPATPATPPVTATPVTPPISPATTAPATPPAAPTEIENARANLKKAEQPAPVSPRPSVSELQDVKLQTPSPQKNTVVLPPVTPRTGNSNVTASQAKVEINLASNLTALQTELNSLAKGQIKPESIPRIEEIQNSSAAVIQQLAALGKPGVQTIALMDEATKNLNVSKGIVNDTLQGYEKRLNNAKDMAGITQIVTELGSIANREQFQNIITRRSAEFTNAQNTPAVAEIKPAITQIKKDTAATTAKLHENARAQALNRSLNTFLKEMPAANTPEKIAAAKASFNLMQAEAKILLESNQAFPGTLKRIRDALGKIQAEFARIDSLTPAAPLTMDSATTETSSPDSDRTPSPSSDSTTTPTPSPDSTTTPTPESADLNDETPDLPTKGEDTPEPNIPFQIAAAALAAQLDTFTADTAAGNINVPAHLQNLIIQYQNLKNYADANPDTTHHAQPQLESAKNLIYTLSYSLYDSLERLSQTDLQTSQSLINDTKKLETTPDDVAQRDLVQLNLDKLTADLDSHSQLLNVLSTSGPVKHPLHDAIQTALDTVKSNQEIIKNNLAALPAPSIPTAQPLIPIASPTVMPTPTSVTTPIPPSPPAFDHTTILKKLPPEPVGRPNQCANLTEDSIIRLGKMMENSKDLSLLNKRMEYFNEKRDEAKIPNEMNLGIREKLISDWNNKLFPFLEKVNSRMNDLKDVISSLPASESKLKANLENSLKQFEQIRADLYNDQSGIRQTIENRLKDYGLHSIKIKAHEVKSITRAPGETDQDFKEKIRQECETMLGKPIIPSVSDYNLTGPGYKFNTVTETAIVRIDGILDPRITLDDKSRQTIYTVQTGALPSQSQVSVQHLREDLNLTNVLYGACIQHGLGNHLADPTQANQQTGLANLLGSYHEVPFTKNGLQTFLENKVKNHELSLPNFSLTGPTCKSMAAGIFDSYQTLMRDPKNKEVPHTKTLQVAMQLMRDYINVTRGQEKIPAHNKDNYELNRAVQLICEVMQRASKGDTWIFKYDSSLTGRSEVFSGSTIRDTQKLLAGMDIDFVKTLGQGMDMVAKTEQKRRIEDTVNKLATTENAMHDEPAPAPSSPRPGGGAPAA